MASSANVCPLCAKVDDNRGVNLYLSSRNKGQLSVIKISDVNVHKTVVNDLQARSFDKLNVQPISDQIELVFHGRILTSENSLCVTGVYPGAIVHVLRKPSAPDMPDAEPVPDGLVNRVLMVLQAALRNPAYRNLIEPILSNPVTIQSALATIPGLRDDPVAIAILQDYDMLVTIGTQSRLNKFLAAHPALGPAALQLGTALHEEITKNRDRHLWSQNAGGRYLLDQVSDDEDMETGEARAGPANITTDQLATALALASGGLSDLAQSAMSRPIAPTEAPPPAVTPITTDFFRQAMAAGGFTVPQQPRTEESVLNDQIEQLVGLGIADEALSRRALQATGGDIEAAIELIFAGQVP